MAASRKRIVIIGATSRIAEHCARLWVKESPVELVLVGRDVARIELVAADLRVRSPASRIEALEADFVDPEAIQSLVDEIAGNGSIDTVLIAHGTLPDQQQCQLDPALCRDILVINGISPVLFAEAFAGHLEQAGSGTLVIIGSVAGDRGRKTNYVYGSAKGMVTRYAQGLQHRLAFSGVKVVLVKPGPTDTPMTAHLKKMGKGLASAEDVASGIIRAASRGNAVAYVPAKWALVMMIIRHLPSYLFNKLSI